jgi:hypothetical protein
MNAILDEYRHRTKRSAATMERSFDVIAGGVSRNFGYHIPYPVMNDRGAGCLLYDVDGNEYIDFAYNGMSLIHGHAFGPVVQEIKRVASLGWAWPGSSLAQIEFCRTASLANCGRSRFVQPGLIFFPSDRFVLVAGRRLNGALRRKSPVFVLCSILSSPSTLLMKVADC